MQSTEHSSKKLSKQEIELQNKSFYQVNPENLFDGFRNCRANARKLFLAAEKVSSESSGAANSLMILCAEECVKCFVLFAVCANIPVPFLIKPIFSQHWAKHATGKELHGFVRMVSQLFGLFSPKASDKAKSAFDLLLNVAGAGGSEEEDWWDCANDIKNNGLYVDFRDGKFHGPEAISAETFNKSRRIVTRFITLIDKTEFIKPEDLAELKDLNK